MSGLRMKEIICKPDTIALKENREMLVGKQKQTNKKSGKVIYKNDVKLIVGRVFMGEKLLKF